MKKVDYISQELGSLDLESQKRIFRELTKLLQKDEHFNNYIENLIKKGGYRGIGNAKNNSHKTRPR